MRIALIHVAQETNDFNPVLTTLADYEAFGIFEGAEILREYISKYEIDCDLKNGGIYAAVSQKKVHHAESSGHRR